MAGQLNCKHSPVSMLEFCELWWTFWLGGGSVVGMLIATEVESRELEVIIGSEGGLGAGEMGKGIEGRWEEVQGG